MAGIKYKTRGMSTPHQKAKVFLSCHFRDFYTYFDIISNEILSHHDCSIWYIIPDSILEHNELEEMLAEMQLIVIPVTANLLCDDNDVINLIVPYAQRHKIPILPIMQETGLISLYEEKFGNLQYLDKNSLDNSAISYQKKLEHYLSSVLVSDELAQKIRNAFDAYIFLSYRKKDRKHAQELMHLIHSNDFCRDIAIWYDEFLVPGEDFNDAIRSALIKSDLFALVVTPNLVNEPNYVMTIEYPLAKNKGKPVLPIELAATDRVALQNDYKDIPECIPAHIEELRNALFCNLSHIAKEKSDSPEHCFFIGLAYLEGLDLEIDYEKALKLIGQAARQGLPEAMKKLATMYYTGQGVARDIEQAIYWQNKFVESFAIENALLADKTEQYATARFDLANLWLVADEIDSAIASIEPLLSSENDKYQQNQQMRTIANTAHLITGILLNRRKYFYDAKKHYRSVYSSYDKADKGSLVEEDYCLWITACVALMDKSTDGHVYAVKALEISTKVEVPMSTKCYIWKAICTLLKPFSLRASKAYAEMIAKAYEKLSAESGHSRENQIALALAYREMGKCCTAVPEKKQVYEQSVNLLEHIVQKYNIEEDKRTLVVLYNEFASFCVNENEQGIVLQKCLQAAENTKITENDNDVICSILASISMLVRMLIRNSENATVNQYIDVYKRYIELQIANGDISAMYRLKAFYASIAAMYKHEGDLQRASFYQSKSDEINAHSYTSPHALHSPTSEAHARNINLAIADFSPQTSMECYEKIANIAIQHISQSGNPNVTSEHAQVYEQLAIRYERHRNSTKANSYYKKAMALRKQRP